MKNIRGIPLIAIISFVIALVIRETLEPSIDGWVGCLGNLFGGVIGALVAYYVANMQIKNMREQENLKSYLAQKPAVLKLENELKKVVFGYESGITASKDANSIIKELVVLELPELNEEYWKAADLILNMETQAILIGIKDKYPVYYQAISERVDILKCELNKALYNNDQEEARKLSLNIIVCQGKKESVFKSINQDLEKAKLALSYIESLKTELCQHGIN